MDQIITRKHDKKQDLSEITELKDILKQIGETKTYYQVDLIINSLVTVETTNIQTLSKLENQLEKLSPLTVTSSEWSSLRYALICLRKINASMKREIAK